MIARVLLGVVLTAGLLEAQVGFDRILHPEKEPQNWLTYSGSLTGQRFSPLTQINTGNVKNLELQWIWQAKSLEKYEATALVVDGVMYTVTGASPATPTTNDVVALDARSMTGLQLHNAAQLQSKKTHRVGHAHSQHLHGRGMNAYAAVRREAQRGVDAKRNIHTLMHHAGLNQLTPLGVHAQLAQWRASVPKHVTIEQRGQTRSVDRYLSRVNAERKGPFVVECRDFSCGRRKQCAAKALDVQDNPAVDVKVDMPHLGLYRAERFHRWTVCARDVR